MTVTLKKSALTDRFTEFAPLSTAAADYDIVRRAIAHIRGDWRAQPEIDVIANAAGVSATDLHHLFRRWCGLTPKAFLQALTLNHARDLLRSSASVLDTAYEVGLSGPGRLHDLFVTHEAMSPGEWKAGGEGLTITYGFHPCPFGMALVMKVGGASGPLYGTLFMTLGKELPAEPGVADLLRAYDAAIAAVKARGKSDVGQKTMLDVLAPACEALAAGNDPRAAAGAAAEATIPMRAIRGRASFLGERSIGHMDPGARSSALIIAAIVDVVERAA